MRHVLLVALLLFCSVAQAFVLRGTITDNRNERLPYTNIYVKGTSNGTSANADGAYQIELPKGEYEIIFQHLGFKQRIEKVQLNGDLELNVKLEQLQYEIRDVIINASEDPAIAVIKKAIERRKYFLNVVESYSCDAYVKGMQRILEAPDKILGRKINTTGLLTGPKNSGILYLSESQSKLYYKKPNKWREVITSSKVSGRSNGFTFNSAQDFYFNFYERSITIPFIAQRPFISPLAENTFFYYNFKMIGAYKEGDRLINKILVTPKRKADPCFAGVLSIVEDNWNIHSLELYLTKNNGLQYVDTLKVTQYFIPVKDDLWLPTQQRYDAKGGFLGVKGDGYYLGIFKNYQLNNLFGAKADSKVAQTETKPKTDQKKLEKENKRLEKKVEKQVFSAEIIKIETEANKRDTTYWDSIRPIPLTELEMQDYHFKDSIQVIRDSKEFKDSTDKKRNKPSIISIITGYTFRRQSKDLQFDFPSLLNIANYNTVEGLNLQFKFVIRKDFGKQHRLSVEPAFRYGFANRHFNSMATVSFRISQLRSESISVSGGKYVTQFNEAQPQRELVNTIVSILLRRNLLKLYEQYFLRITYSREIVNGLQASFSTHYAHRIPLENMNHWSFYSRNTEQYTRNGMDLPTTNSLNYNISDHRILRFDLKLKINLGSKYVTRPDGKIRLPSKFPEITLLYKKGVPIKGFSDMNFDFLEAQVEGKISMRLLGVMFYRFGGGGFPNHRIIDYADYKHFYGNFLTTGEVDLLGFYLIQYNRFSTNRYFAEAHIEHHFNGFFFNKIPGLRKLKLGEVLGFSFLYTPTRGAYYQIEAGVDNILKILRIDFVTRFGASTVDRYGVRIGIALDFRR